MSQKIKFIDTIIRNMRPENKRVIYWCEDCPGFGLRVTPSGNKSFVYKYTQNGKSVWYTIGKYPEWSIRNARREYEDLYEQVREYGRDPVKENKEIEIAKKNKLTVTDLKNEYIKVGYKKGKTDIKEEERALEKDIIPVIGDKYIDEVTPEDLDIIQNNILERGLKKKKAHENYAHQSGKSALKHTFDYTRQMFNVAIDRGLMKTNPVSKIENYGTSNIRERILNFKEIWLFWNKIEHVGLPPVTANALKFILVTMQRGKEVREMKYSSLKLDEKIWEMSMDDTKNKTMHRVPLNYYALGILGFVNTHTSRSKYVFGSTKATDPLKNMCKTDLKPMGKSALARAMDRKRELLGIENITPHDLRRTAATWLAGVGLLPHYAKLMLNHKDSRSDVTNSVYIQYSYDAEKRKATDIWALVLDSIVKCPTIDDVPSLEDVRKIVQESEFFVG